MTIRPYNVNQRLLYNGNPALVQTQDTEIIVAIRDIGGALTALHALDWIFQGERTDIGIDTVALRLDPSLSTRPEGATLYIPRNGLANYVVFPYKIKANLWDVLAAYLKMLTLPSEQPNGKREVQVVGIPTNTFVYAVYEIDARIVPLGQRGPLESCLVKGPSVSGQIAPDPVPQFLSVREPPMGRGFTPKLHEIVIKIKSRNPEIRFLEPSGAFLMPNR